MASLIVSGTASLDGFVNDREGSIDWTDPGPEAHRFVNDLLRPVGTYLLGRRLFQTMLVWETMDLEGQPEHTRDFAEIWAATDKIVYSGTLDAVTGGRTRLERSFDTAAVRRLKETADRDLVIGGPGLAAHAFRARLVDEVRIFLAPIALGGGTPYFPDDLRIDLELVETRRFDTGSVFVRYRVRS